MSSRRVILDAYAARTCAVKTWNAHSPVVEVPERTPDDEALRESFEGGISFTDLVVAELTRRVGTGPVADLRTLRGVVPAAEQAAATIAAMRGGAQVVVGGLLPLDVAGHRSGRADLWVRGADTADGLPGYHPVLVRRHLATEKRQSGRTRYWVEVSQLAQPGPAYAIEVENRAIRTGREGALLQLGHYWRLLQAAGHAAAGPARGGIIGTDEYAWAESTEEQGVDLGVTWVELEVPLIRTFSRSSETGWRLRTVLERYDHEHGFRVRVAQNAQAGGEPMVQPIRNRECDSCPWWQVCAPQLGEDDLSVRIDKAPLDVREISVLRSLGVRTITDLAEINLDELMPRYLPEVAHRPAAERRLQTAAHRARMMVASVDLERLTTGPIHVPRADIEIDLDIETAADERVYLWGFLVHDTRADEPPRYVEFSAWEDLDRPGEAELARRAMAWLAALVDGPASVQVYHYSSYEAVRLNQIAAAEPHPDLDRAVERSHDWCDLFLTMKEHWFGTRGLGLKVVATLGAGFTWRDEEPGGLNSQAWFEQACHGESEQVRTAARQRVLDYNEDDVRATWWLRRWLREQS